MAYVRVGQFKARAELVAAMVATIRHAFAAPPVLTTYDAYGIPE